MPAPGLAGRASRDRKGLPATAALLPHLDDHWCEQVVRRGIDGLDLNPIHRLDELPPWNWAAAMECRKVAA